MSEVGMNIIALILSFLIPIITYKATGLEKKFINSDKLVVPGLFAVSAVALFFILRWLGSFLVV